MTTRKRLPFVIGHLSSTILILLVACSPLLAGCGAKDPFRYVRVSGKVTYEDGSLVPVDSLRLTFSADPPVKVGKDHARPGVATVDRANGEFRSVTSHTAGDGLVAGKYKVTLAGVNATSLSPSVVPPEYTDFNRTPLQVDTAKLPFDLKIAKPR